LEDIPAQATEGDPAQETLEAMDRERLQAAIHLLTPDQQQVLALRYGEGLTARETARIVRKTTGAVEALQRRALAAIKRILAKQASPDRSKSQESSRTGKPTVVSNHL
jgi:RNA polymerase sigma factor (sigma-70 family)